MSSFLWTAGGIWFVYSLFGLAPPPAYRYDVIWQQGATHLLFVLMMAAIARRLFGDEHLTYFRECKTGISATAYWLSKNIYNMFTGYLFALVYTCAIYYNNIPMQKFDDVNELIFMTFWYWSGAAQAHPTFHPHTPTRQFSYRWSPCAAPPTPRTTPPSYSCFGRSSKCSGTVASTASAATSRPHPM